MTSFSLDDLIPKTFKMAVDLPRVGPAFLAELHGDRLAVIYHDAEGQPADRMEIVPTVLAWRHFLRTAQARNVDIWNLRSWYGDVALPTRWSFELSLAGREVKSAGAGYPTVENHSASQPSKRFRRLLRAVRGLLANQDGVRSRNARRGASAA